MTIAVEFAPGAIANEHGDIFGNSPFRIIRDGNVTIEREWAEGALAFGWRVVPKSGPDCDDDFVWLTRTPAEREAVNAGRTDDR